MKLITDKTALLDAIKSIQTRGKKLDNDIWVAAVSAMQHHDTHGDVTIVNQVVEAMPKGSRVNAMRDFILANGKVSYDEENEVFVHDKTGNFDLDGATEKSWVEYKPEPKFKPVDLLADIAKLVAKAEKAAGEPDTKKAAQHKIDVKALSALKALVPAK